MLGSTLERCPSHSGIIHLIMNQLKQMVDSPLIIFVRLWTKLEVGFIASMRFQLY